MGRSRTGEVGVGNRVFGGVEGFGRVFRGEEFLFEEFFVGIAEVILEERFCIVLFYLVCSVVGVVLAGKGNDGCVFYAIRWMSLVLLVCRASISCLESKSRSSS